MPFLPKTYRRPSQANEWQLWYFACTDIGVAHTLSRTFFWWQNILWRHDVPARTPVAVFLAGRDQVVDTASVRDYLTLPHEGEDEEGAAAPEWKVVWCEELDHAQAFESRLWLPVLVDEVLSKCAAIEVPRYRGMDD